MFGEVVEAFMLPCRPFQLSVATEEHLVDGGRGKELMEALEGVVAAASIHDSHLEDEKDWEGAE